VRLSPPTGRHLAPVAGRVRAACVHCRTGGLAARPSRACSGGCRPGTFVPDAAAQDSTGMGTFG